MKIIIEDGDFKHTIVEISDQMCLDLSVIMGIDPELEVANILSKELDEFIRGYVRGNFHQLYSTPIRERVSNQNNP